MVERLVQGNSQVRTIDLTCAYINLSIIHKSTITHPRCQSQRSTRPHVSHLSVLSNLVPRMCASLGTYKSTPQCMQAPHMHLPHKSGPFSHAVSCGNPHQRAFDRNAVPANGSVLFRCWVCAMSSALHARRAGRVLVGGGGPGGPGTVGPQRSSKVERNPTCRASGEPSRGVIRCASH
jgi:hypothetical protein